MNGLRRVRERRALTQAELAERAGVMPATISRLENGQQRAYPSTVRKLAKALSVEPVVLYGEAED